mmetsp:Transcript_30702/g.99553  ORF Transcript_30702/g.99553 Transcript_30702/m.99553 type:complete len:235 (-) Transcript_30702:486-1190(-)
MPPKLWGPRSARGDVLLGAVWRRGEHEPGQVRVGEQVAAARDGAKGQRCDRYAERRSDRAFGAAEDGCRRHGAARRERRRPCRRHVEDRDGEGRERWVKAPQPRRYLGGGSAEEVPGAGADRRAVCGGDGACGRVEGGRAEDHRARDGVANHKDLSHAREGRQHPLDGREGGSRVGGRRAGERAYDGEGGERDRIEGPCPLRHAATERLERGGQRRRQGSASDRSRGRRRRAGG